MTPGTNKSKPTRKRDEKIIEDTILPRFRANDMAGGIEQGVDAVIKVLSDD